MQGSAMLEMAKHDHRQSQSSGELNEFAAHLEQLVDEARRSQDQTPPPKIDWKLLEHYVVDAINLMKKRDTALRLDHQTSRSIEKLILKHSSWSDAYQKLLKKLDRPVSRMAD
jgi:hypothetical protein